MCSLMWLAAAAQDVTRDLKIGAGGSLQIVNPSGRVTVRAEPASADGPAVGRLTATAVEGVTPSEIKLSSGGSRTTVNVSALNAQKRIDVMVTLPERTSVRIQTLAGAIEVAGNFLSVEAITETGTVATDIPTGDLEYKLVWTESRPRYLADLDLEPVKEKSAGRFEIKGRTGEKGAKKARSDTSEGSNNGKSGKDEGLISLEVTTARGIVLINVPTNEVTTDLRERPLTEAAKAIVRSGDSLLTEAIRRASPKYFGDYSRTLGPVKREPSFAIRDERTAVPNGDIKTAVVRVTDAKNRAITGLGKNDFEVLENGSDREIVSVSRSTAPFNLVLLLDVSGSVENYVDFIRRAARSFVETVGKDDRVGIVIFNEDVKKLSDPTADKAELSASLDSFDAGGGTAYYDALAYTIADTLRPLKGQRTAVVIITDGDDNRSFLSFDPLIGSIQESGALIYPLYVPSALIAAGTAGGDIDPMRKKYMSLSAKSEGEGDRLAKISGGVYYPITQLGQMQKAYEDIVVQLRSGYNVKFRSDTGSGAAAGASPRLKIKVKRNNLFTTISSVAVRE